MSPINQEGKNYKEADSFFRNERGLKEMTLLLSFLSMSIGIALIVNGVVGYWFQIDGWTSLIQSGVGIVLASGGLQAWEAKLESNNLTRQ